MKLTVTPRQVIALIIALSFPAISLAEIEGDSYFTAKPASHRTTLTGFTRARATMNLTSQLTERIIEIKADTGEPIGEDGVFARLDPTFAELDLKRIVIEQGKLTSRIEYLDKETRRIKTLFEKQSISETKLDSIKQELDQSRLTLDELHNQEKRLREHLRRHLVTGPTDWLVIKRFAEPGEWVTAGAPLAKIGDFRSLVVPFAVNHDEYLLVKREAENLTLRLPEEDLSVPAELYKISPDFDQQTRKTNLELIIQTVLPEQRGGIRAELTIELPDPANALLVPESAVNNRYDSHWLTRADGEKIPVIVLGPGPDLQTIRVTSDEIKAGDKFMRNPDVLSIERE